jgi:hypothetical protein
MKTVVLISDKNLVLILYNFNANIGGGMAIA